MVSIMRWSTSKFFGLDQPGQLFGADFPKISQGVTKKSPKKNLQKNVLILGGPENPNFGKADSVTVHVDSDYLNSRIAN